MLTDPSDLLRAPYFAALVASSLRSRPNCVAWSLDRCTVGPSSRTRDGSSPKYPASCSRAMAVRSAPFHSLLTSRSCDLATASRRELRDSCAYCLAPLPRNDCVTMDCTTAGEFFTRCDCYKRCRL